MSDQHVHQAEFPEAALGGQPVDEEPATALLDFKKTIRIAVTGDVLLTAAETVVIDTADFQRLRGVRQLGTVNFVFPTALHTRFDHSLGTLARADEMVLAIATNAKITNEARGVSLIQRKLARMYALLHDIPHVPFGHTIEDEMGLFRRHDQNPARINRFLGPESEVAANLREHESPDFYDRLMAIYLWEDDAKEKEIRESDKDWEALSKWFDMPEDDALVHDIVSNTVCADLLDYVARDNYFCNLGISLEYRFIKYLYLKRKTHRKGAGQSQEQNANEKRRVFVQLWKAKENRPRRDLLTDLTRLMDARYMVAERAYFHHAKLVTCAMLGRAIQEYSMVDSGEEYLYENSDDTLLKKLCDWEHENKRTKTDGDDPLGLATLLSRRKLHRTAAMYGDASFEGAQDEYHQAALKVRALKALRNPLSRRDFENWCAAVVGKRPGSVLVYAPSEKMNVKVAEVNVHWKGEDRTLSEIDDTVVKPRLATVIKAHQSLWSIRLVVARDVADEEVRLLKEAFELAFLVPEGEEVARRKAHVFQIVERGLVSFNLKSKISPRRYQEVIKESAEPLLETARGTGAEEKLKKAIARAEREFRSEGGEAKA